MHWINTATPRFVPPDVQLAFQRENAARAPRDADQQAQLGDLLLDLGKHDEAASVFEQARTLGGGGPQWVFKLAKFYLRMDRPGEALEVCDQALKSWYHPNLDYLHFLRGKSLQNLQRPDDAYVAFLASMRASPSAYRAADPAEHLMLALAADPDDRRLLAFCDKLPPSYSDCTVVRGYRALALSRAGRADEAQRLVDLGRYILRVPFEPPREFDGIDNFNRLLAEEILNNPGLVRGNYNFLRTESLGLAGERAFLALTVFMRGTIEKFITEFQRRGLCEIMPRPPSQGTLFAAGNVVRAGDRHLPHLHKYAYVSGVYHVAVPRDDGDRVGALVVGPWGTETQVTEQCWGSRYIDPVAGVATIFPSHIFHSIVPTRSTEPRIAVPFDLHGLS